MAVSFISKIRSNGTLSIASDLNTFVIFEKSVVLFKRGLQILYQAIHLGLGEDCPARHHRIEITTGLILAFDDRQRHLIGNSAAACICGIGLGQLRPAQGRRYDRFFFLGEGDPGAIGTMSGSAGRLVQLFALQSGGFG